MYVEELTFEKKKYCPENFKAININFIYMTKIPRAFNLIANLFGFFVKDRHPSTKQYIYRPLLGAKELDFFTGSR